MESDKNASRSGKVSRSNKDRVQIAESLFGILPNDVTLEEAKEEHLEQMLKGNPEEAAGHAESGSGSCISDRQGTRDLFEKFYGKPYDEITEADVGPGEDIDWGNDIGGEKF